jgi:molybdopterin synthase sulfur carrier subunit
MSCHKILLFGAFRDRMKTEALTVQLPAGATAGDVLKAVCGAEEEALRWQRCMRVAVNCKYVAHDAVLHDGDEVALIPPVAGG